MAIVALCLLIDGLVNTFFMNLELMVIGMVLLLYGVGYVIYYTYGKDEPPTKHYDHYW